MFPKEMNDSWRGKVLFTLVVKAIKIPAINNFNYKPMNHILMQTVEVSTHKPLTFSVIIFSSHLTSNQLLY